MIAEVRVEAYSSKPKKPHPPAYLATTGDHHPVSDSSLLLVFSLFS